MSQYLLKCLIGASICHLLTVLFPQYPFYWSSISVLLVFSVEHKNHLAFDRMKANLLGSAAAFLVFFIPMSDFMQLLAGVVIVVLIGFALKLVNAMRSALAALVIVLVREEQEKNFVAAMERISCVVVGCVVALIVTILFHYGNRRYLKYKRNKLYRANLR